MSAREAIADWSNMLVNSVFFGWHPASQDIRLVVHKQMKDWLRSPAANVVEVPRQKIEALRKAKQRFEDSDNAARLWPRELVDTMKSVDAILACASPPKDAILSALENALEDKPVGPTMPDQIKRAIALRKAELKEAP